MSYHNLRDRQTEIAIYILFKCGARKKHTRGAKETANRQFVLYMRENAMKNVAYFQATTGTAAAQSECEA